MCVCVACRNGGSPGRMIPERRQRNACREFEGPAEGQGPLPGGAGRPTPCGAADRLQMGKRPVRAGRGPADPAGGGAGHHLRGSAGAGGPARGGARRNSGAAGPHRRAAGGEKPPGPADLEDRGRGADRLCDGQFIVDSIELCGVPQFPGGGRNPLSKRRNSRAESRKSVL